MLPEQKKKEKDLKRYKKAFKKIQHPLTIKKIFIKLGTEENFLSLIKDICEKPIANSIVNGERMNSFPLKSRTKQCFTAPIQYHTGSSNQCFKEK